jgi:hypothetical protein
MVHLQKDVLVETSFMTLFTRKFPSTLIDSIVMENVEKGRSFNRHLVFTVNEIQFPETKLGLQTILDQSVSVEDFLNTVQST